MTNTTPTSDQPEALRLHCVRCGYSLVGITLGNPCPECGTSFISPNPADQRCGKAIAAFVLGIFSIPLSPIFGTGLIPGVLAVIFAKTAKKRAHDGLAPRFSLDFAKSGRVTGWIGIIFSVIYLIVWIIDLVSRHFFP